MQVTDVVVSNSTTNSSTASLSEAVSAASPPGSRTTGQRRERTRVQILEAAREALVRVGYENITTRRIAEEAGVNVATLHYYFGTKEILLSEAMHHALRAVESGLRAAIADAPDAPTALERLFQAVWLIVRERAGVLRYDLAVRGMRDEDARRDANALYETFRALVTEVIEWHLQSGGTLAPGITLTFLSHYVVASADGVILQHKLNGDDEITAQSLNLIKQSALEIMQSGSSPPFFAITRPDDKPAAMSGTEETE